MWRLKKDEQTAPRVSTPPGTKTAGPLSAPLEGTAMSTDAIRSPSTASDHATARLNASLHVKGDISGKGDLHIDGSIEGQIQLEDGKLTVGPRARVNADVVAREIVVYGSIKGNLRAHDRIEITKDGSVVGNLLAGRILIEDGANFKGSIEIDRKAEGERVPDPPAPARNALKSS